MKEKIDDITSSDICANENAEIHESLFRDAGIGDDDSLGMITFCQ